MDDSAAEASTEASRQDDKNKLHYLYLVVDKKGTVRYVGRSSCPQKRCSAHNGSKRFEAGGFSLIVLGNPTSDKEAIRLREQAAIEAFGRDTEKQILFTKNIKTKGTLLNQRNEVAIVLDEQEEKFAIEADTLELSFSEAQKIFPTLKNPSTILKLIQGWPHKAPSN